MFVYFPFGLQRLQCQQLRQHSQQLAGRDLATAISEGWSVYLLFATINRHRTRRASRQTQSASPPNNGDKDPARPRAILRLEWGELCAGNCYNNALLLMRRLPFFYGFNFYCPDFCLPEASLGRCVIRRLSVALLVCRIVDATLGH